MRMVRRTGLIAITAVCALCATVGLSRTANADVWDNRKPKYGYFDNGRPYNKPYEGDYKGLLSAPRYVTSTITPAIPYSVTTPQEYYDYMYDKYHHSGNPDYAKSYGKFEGVDFDEKDRTGVSFMVNALLGRNGDEAHRVPTAADWQDLRDTLLQKEVKLVQFNHTDASSYRGEDSYYQVGRNDVGKTQTEDDGGRAFAILYNGEVKWVVLYKCGNVLGDWDGIPRKDDTTDWGVGTTINADRASVNVGEKITWTHTVTQQGPNPTDQAVTYGYRNSGNLAGLYDSGTLAAGTPAGTTRSFTTTYTPTIADSGKTVCRQTYANPSANGAGWALSDVSCVNVNVYYNYQLTPSVTLPSGGTRDTYQPGDDDKPVTPRVTLTGETGSKPTTWQLTRCVYAPNTAYPSATGTTPSATDAKTTFGGACTVPQSGTETYTATKQYGASENGAGAVTGSHVCYILSVNPPSSSAGGWLHSAPACFAVLKTPKVQALGGDVRAGSVTTAAPRQTDGSYYGSWAEYGIFGVGGITGIGSAGSLAGGAASNNAARLNALTFANANSGGCQLGCFYAQAPVQSDFDAYSAIAGPTATSAGQAVPNGTREVRHVSGNLVINGNITYSGSYADPSQVPRVIYVVDGDITIADGVTRIDAWLIATGTLYTCQSFTNPGDPGQRLTNGKCDQQLTFNGPVTVGKTVLGRTYGADPAPASRTQAAEVFNLAPSNYLSGFAAGQTRSNIQTVYEKELPPRF